METILFLETEILDLSNLKKENLKTRVKEREERKVKVGNI